MLFVAVCAAAASAVYVAWATRHLVGLVEDGWSCTLDPAWRAHLAWWFLPIGIVMLTASAWSLLQAIRGRGDGKAGLPLVVCVAGLASLWSLNAMAFGGFNAGCSSPGTINLHPVYTVPFAWWR